MTLSKEVESIRFWAKVVQNEGCWEWQASLDSSGYGQFYWRGKPRRASRVAWELSFGEVPADAHVLHHCDNSRCVRPDHLFLGDQRANMQDMAAKGRHWRHDQTLCPFGHPLVTRPDGERRHCPICDKASKAASFQRKYQDPEFKRRKAEAQREYRARRRATQ